MTSSCRHSAHVQPASTTMNLIDAITSQLGLLPREAQQEVLDFVQYLVAKYDANAPSEEQAWDELATHEHPFKRPVDEPG